MTVIRRRFFDVGAGQGHLRQVGSPGERPAVVLLHHAPSSSACWDPVLPLLAQAGLAAFALDLPGFGQSSPARSAPDLGWYADSARDVLDALE